MNNDIPQSERKRIMIEAKATYLSHAEGSAEDERQGRFGAVGKTLVTGSSTAIQYPRQPITSPSNHKAMMPEEPPIDGRSEGLTLGFEIDRPEGLPSTASASVVEGAGDGLGTTSEVRRPTFKRRV
jgi:hypothetical protein